MRIVTRWIAGAALCAAGTLLFCSFDESTGLGNEIINDVNPDKVKIGRHYREFRMDSAQLQERYSVPRAGDSGFGVHMVTADVMVIGRKGDEESAGLVAFFCPSDTDTKRSGKKFFNSGDSLVSVRLLFARPSRDSALPSFKMKVFSAANANTVFADADSSPSYTLSIADTSLIDSVELDSGPLRDSIFSSCRSLDTNYMNDTFKFGLINISTDTLFGLNSASSFLKIAIRRHQEAGKSDTVLSAVYKVNKACFVGREDAAIRLSRESQTVSSYAPSRTAVYAFNADSLWTAMDDVLPGSPNRLISAGFVIRHPANDTNTLYVKHKITGVPLHDGAALDSIFTVRAGVTELKRDTVYFADVRNDLQELSRKNPRPSTLYFYLRIHCDKSVGEENGNWQTTTWDAVPYLKAIIYQP
jgi:hypothetical protein